MPVPRLEPLPVDVLTDEQRALYDAILGGPRRKSNLTAADGSLRGPFDAMLRNPEVGRPLQQVGAALRFASSLPEDIRELLILQCAARCGCEFEWNVHRPLAESAGVPSELIAALRAGQPTQTDDQRLAVVIRVADELLASRSLDDAAFTEALALLGDQQLIELIVLLGYYQTLAMLLNSLGITS